MNAALLLGLVAFAGVAAVVFGVAADAAKTRGETRRFRLFVALAVSAVVLFAALGIFAALPAFGEVGIVPGQSPAIPAEVRWCGKPVSGTEQFFNWNLAGPGWQQRFNALRWVPFDSSTPRSECTGVTCHWLVGCAGAEGKLTAKGWLDDLCEAGLLGPYQAPGSWDCNSTRDEWEVVAGLGTGRANPVQSLWHGLLGPSVRERAVEAGTAYAQCGVYQRVSARWPGQREWVNNTHPDCGKTRPAGLPWPWFPGPVPEDILLSPYADIQTTRGPNWPAGACYYDSRSAGSFSSPTILALDIPECREEIEPPLPPVAPPTDPTDPPVDPVDPPVVPPPAECDLAAVEASLETIQATLAELLQRLEAHEAADAARAKVLMGHHSTLYVHTSAVCGVAP